MVKLIINNKSTLQLERANISAQLYTDICCDLTQIKISLFISVLQSIILIIFLINSTNRQELIYKINHNNFIVEREIVIFLSFNLIYHDGICLALSNHIDY